MATSIPRPVATAAISPSNRVFPVPASPSISTTPVRRRLGRILIGRNTSGASLVAEELGCAGSMAVLLKDALLPNLVQTMEGTPAFVHTGPFGNIAHGNCSIVSDAIALRSANFVVTEAGFGSDLGAEKFFNIKCRVSGFKPSVAVVRSDAPGTQASWRRRRRQGRCFIARGLTGPNQDALAKGFCNLQQHIENVRAHGVPVVVAVNAFEGDSPSELDWTRQRSLEAGAVGAAVSTHWADGGEGLKSWLRLSSRPLLSRHNSRIFMSFPGL